MVTQTGPPWKQVFRAGPRCQDPNFRGATTWSAAVQPRSDRLATTHPACYPGPV